MLIFYSYKRNIKFDIFNKYYPVSANHERDKVFSNRDEIETRS
jgi:hypothetical protein